MCNSSLFKSNEIQSLNDKAIEKRLKEGRSFGSRTDYLPFLTVRDISSKGHSHRGRLGNGQVKLDSDLGGCYKLPLEWVWRAGINCRMYVFGVVKMDIFSDSPYDFLLGWVAVTTANRFHFQTSEKALHHRIIPAIPAAVHIGLDPSSVSRSW